MANVFLPITVPATTGSGAPVNVSALGFSKLFSLSGSFGSVLSLGATINIEASNDGATWVPIASMNAANDIKKSFASVFVRATVIGDATGATLSVGADNPGTDMTALAVPVTNGTGAAVDLSTFGTEKTFIYNGGMEASITIEVSQDGGITYSEAVSFAGRTPASVAVYGAISFARVKVAGFVFGTGVISVCAARPSAGVSPDPQYWQLGSGVDVISFENGVIQNIEQPVTGQVVFVRYASKFDSLPQDGIPPSETTACYWRVDSPYINPPPAVPVTREQHWAHYIEIMPSVDNTETGDAAGGGVKVIHRGRGGDAYDTILMGEGAVGYEAATYYADDGIRNGTKGFIATLQVLAGAKVNAPNATFFTCLWESEVVPNYGLSLYQQCSGHAITIERYNSTNFGGSGVINEGQAMIRIVVGGYSRNLWTVFNSGRTDLSAQVATALAPLKNSPEFTLIGTYWNGAASVDRSAQMVHSVTSATRSTLQVKVGNLAAEVLVASFTNDTGVAAFDMQGNQIVTVGGIVFTAAATLDLQTGTITNVGTLTMTVGGDIDMQNGDITNVNSIAYFGAGSIDLQGGTVINCVNLQAVGQFDIYGESVIKLELATDAATADGETSLLIRRNVAAAFSLQRVSMGIADSGGVGFKLLRVPN